MTKDYNTAEFEVKPANYTTICNLISTLSKQGSTLQQDIIEIEDRISKLDIPVKIQEVKSFEFFTR
jgi:hypothetical protein